jgi:ankyrin repeat protein
VDDTTKILIAMLTRHFADINGRNWRGSTPLMEAIESENESIVKMLLEQGVDVHLMDADGNTALRLSKLCSGLLVWRTLKGTM